MIYSVHISNTSGWTISCFYLYIKIDVERIEDPSLYGYLIFFRVSLEFLIIYGPLGFIIPTK